MLIPTSQFVRSLVAARLAADVLDVPTVLIARTDAHSAQLLTSDVDPQDRPFIHGERTPEGFYRYDGGIKVTTVPSPLPTASLLPCGMSFLLVEPSGFNYYTIILSDTTQFGPHSAKYQ